MSRAGISVMASLLALVSAVGCADAHPLNALEPDSGALRQDADPWACELSAADTACVAGEDAGVAGDDAQVEAGNDALCGSELGGTTVGLSRLFSELVDLLALARLPSPAYESRFVSSHNPVSDAAEPGSADWFANQDRIVLAEGETATLLDVAGPGVVTRIWAASPAGTLRIYVDDDEQPAVEGDMRELLRGDVEPLVAPFAFVAAGGHNLYFPIPFARSLRVTLTGPGESVYFHVSYRSYEAGTRVESFSAESLASSACVRSRVAERLLELEADIDASHAGELHSFELRTDARDAVATIEAEPGGSVLWQLRAWPTRVEPELLRATVLVIEFDGEETVRVPFGDFFASGVQPSDLSSLPVGVQADGAWTARWAMPFQSRARIAIEAASEEHAEVLLDVVTSALPWTERSLLFHAGWHAPDTFPSKPSSDWDLAAIEGTGLYVGNVLNVLNRNEQWWGEGDEKIYVDGETFPSHFGTGTEDYYGYAWCSNQRFTTAYIGQPLASARQNFGATTLYRFHVLDPIPFRSSLRFDMEVRHWGDPVDVTYDAVSFWYARPGSRMTNAASDASEFRLPALGVDAPDVRAGAYRCGG